MALLAPASTVPSALVALSVFGASAWACLLCFTSYNERLQICQIFPGLESPALGKCEEAFTEAFKGLLDTEIREETPPSSSIPPPGGAVWREGQERPGETGSETQDTGDVVLGGTASPSSCLPPPDYDERSHLHDAFTQMTHSLQEVAAAQGEWRGVGSTGRRGCGVPRRWMLVRGRL